MKKNNKFDILFESIMNNISNKELYGSDVYNTILKIYKFNKATNTFDNLLTEIDNFKYLVPDVNRTEIINDLKLELSDVDPNFDICKIEIYDKESNDLLFDCITFYGTDSNDIIDLLSYTENPRGISTGVPELYNETIDDNAIKTFSVNNFKIKIYETDGEYYYKVFLADKELIASNNEDYGIFYEINDAYINAKNWINDYTETHTIAEDSDKFDETYNQNTIAYNGYKIIINSFDDQGDTVYTWSINNLENDNGAIINDDSYYSTANEALKFAKINVNNLINKQAPVYKPKNKPIANLAAYKGKYFNKLFESVDELQPLYSNEKYIENYNYDVRGNNFKIVIVEVSENDDVYYEYIIGKLDETGNIIDWPLFESSNEFETISLAQSAAEDYIEDYINDCI